MNRLAVTSRASEAADFVLCTVFLLAEDGSSLEIRSGTVRIMAGAQTLAQVSLSPEYRNESMLGYVAAFMHPRFLHGLTASVSVEDANGSPYTAVVPVKVEKRPEVKHRALPTVPRPENEQ